MYDWIWKCLCLALPPCEGFPWDNRRYQAVHISFCADSLELHSLSTCSRLYHNLTQLYLFTSLLNTLPYPGCTHWEGREVPLYFNVFLPKSWWGYWNQCMSMSRSSQQDHMSGVLALLDRGKREEEKSNHTWAEGRIQFPELRWIGSIRYFIL